MANQLQKTKQSSPSMLMANGVEFRLTVKDVQEQFCKNATEQEAMLFIAKCKEQGLNPWVGDANLVKYMADQPAQTIVTREAYEKRAERIPEYDGEEDGIIVLTDNGMEHRQGTFYVSGEVVIGGWCRVFKKGISRPFYESVAFEEFVQRKKDGTPTKMWATKPATMIRKVALVHALRKAFPNTFTGTFDESEMGGSDQQQYVQQPVQIPEVDIIKEEIQEAINQEPQNTRPSGNPF